jgi:prolyl oligopeptidase PreP (S9A serine peptidase family)
MPARRFTMCVRAHAIGLGMVIVGNHDTRVMPMHPIKFAAALQNAQAGPVPALLTASHPQAKEETPA